MQWQQAHEPGRHVVEAILLLALALLWYALGHALSALAPNYALLTPVRAASVLAAAVFTPQAAAAAPAPSADGYEAVWVESPECTACDECTSIAPKVFVYNDQKQAIVVNPKGAKYADLVKAAEKCTAGCLHPGSPWNPAEPGLDKLMARARQHGATILPVDSEHSAVFQALLGENLSTVEHITITASGGAFRDWPMERPDPRPN